MKASEILQIEMYGIDGDEAECYMSSLYHQHLTEQQAETLLAKWDSVDELEAENKRLREALHKIIDCQYSPDKTLANLNGAISNAKNLFKQWQKQ